MMSFLVGTYFILGPIASVPRVRPLVPTLPGATASRRSGYRDSRGSNHAGAIVLVQVYWYPFVAALPLSFYFLTGTNLIRQNLSSRSISLNELNNRTDYTVRNLSAAEASEIMDGIIFSVRHCM